MHRAVALLLFGVLAVAGAFVAPSARGASPDVLVSQVFAGGGNAGAPFSNDFVELFNRGSAAVDVSGWSVQYASATGTSWQVTGLAGTIAPGRHYLVQLASGGTVGAGLPTPDATGTSNLAVSGGKVAVVRSATALTCGATAGSCSVVTSVADLVGYGGATDFEGAVAPPRSTTPPLRRGPPTAAWTPMPTAPTSPRLQPRRGTPRVLPSHAAPSRRRWVAPRRARQSTWTSSPSSRSRSSVPLSASATLRPAARRRRCRSGSP